MTGTISTTVLDAALTSIEGSKKKVIQVTTQLPEGTNNSFYMETEDLDKNPIKIPLANQPANAPIDPEAINMNDPIQFDHQDGINTVVLWKNRRIRQKGYSFDMSAQPQGAGGASEFENDGWSAMNNSVLQNKGPLTNTFE